MMRRSGFKSGRNLIEKYCSPFSIQATKQEMKMKALAAIKVIKLIASIDPLATTSQRPTKNFKDSSIFRISPQESNIPLSNLIINQLKKEKLNSSVLEHFETMMNPLKGITLPTHLHVQKRITDAQIFQKFAFFPNRILTPLVFRIILDLDLTEDTLLYGPAGTSKTSAICFYAQLASYVTQYEFEYDEVLGEDSKSIPRLFYFSYSRRQISNKDKLNQHFANILKSHSPKKILPMLQKKTDSDQIESILKKEFLKKDLKINVVVDQFNAFVANCRRYNQKLQQHKKRRYGNEKAMNNANSKLIQKKQFIQDQIKFWIDMSSSLGWPRVLFNSSVNIQNDILGSDHFDMIRLNLNHHSDITRIEIDYFSALRTQEGLSELINTTFFQLLKHSEKHPDAAEKIKLAFQQDKIVTKIHEQIGSIFLTPLQIRKQLSKKIAEEILEEISKNELPKVKEIISNLLSTFHNKFVEQLTQLSKTFHTSSIKTGIYKLLFLVAFRVLVKQNSEKLSYSTIQIKKKFGITFTIEEQFIDKNVFIYNKEKQLKTVRLKFDASMFLNVTHFANECLAQLLIKDFESYKAYFGIRHAIIGGLIEEKIVNFVGNYKAGLQFKDIKETISSNIFPAPTFLHFLKQRETLGLQERLSSAIAMLKSQDDSIFAKPIVLKEIGKKENKIILQKPSQNNPSFDILFLHRKANENWSIYTVDFTVSGNKTKITNKKQKIIRLMNDVINNYYGEPDETNQAQKNTQKPKITEWNHIIVANAPDDFKEKFPPESFQQKIKNPLNSSVIGKVMCNFKLADINRIVPYLVDNDNDNAAGQMDLSVIIGLLKMFKQK